MVKRSSHIEKLMKSNAYYIIDKLMSPDYENTGYVDNPNKIDQATNTGITQKALDSYISRHKDKNISHDLKKLDAQTIREMYREGTIMILKK